ncbi:hypothetical protein [Planctobacterium marinum]|uniref:hypothetical protein n=1 Tax=Planctobacterium marinum TaxID=1631968 RepID=UPI001E5F2DF1|nr:hypothetical protein [Planctobacterium marinum]MCC2607842.1 hypothetical protein [Planctobacterium marinum]
MVNRRYSIVASLVFVLVSGCSSNSTELAQINQCQENKQLPECLSEEQKQRLGFECKNITVTGSRLPVKQCTTAAQRAAANAAAKDMVNRMQAQGQPQKGN